MVKLLSWLFFSNFECFILRRKEQFRTTTRSSGGIAVYIRDTYVFENKLVLQSEDDIICIKGPLVFSNNNLFRKQSVWLVLYASDYTYY